MGPKVRTGVLYVLGLTEVVVYVVEDGVSSVSDMSVWCVECVVSFVV